MTAYFTAGSALFPRRRVSRWKCCVSLLQLHFPPNYSARRFVFSTQKLGRCSAARGVMRNTRDLNSAKKVACTLCPRPEVART